MQSLQHLQILTKTCRTCIMFVCTLAFFFFLLFEGLKRRSMLLLWFKGWPPLVVLGPLPMCCLYSKSHASFFFFFFFFFSFIFVWFVCLGLTTAQRQTTLKGYVTYAAASNIVTDWATGTVDLGTCSSFLQQRSYFVRAPIRSSPSSCSVACAHVHAHTVFLLLFRFHS